jgi:FHS family L-fucose permease-like MFS transporter
MATISSHESRNTFSSSHATNYSAMAMVTTLFFIWGFCTVLNDVLIPHLQSIFLLNYVEASLIQLAFFGSYFIFAQPAGKLVEWVGYQRTMVIGLLTMGAGALMFLPAASYVSYPMFLGAQVILAAGVTTLQVAANPYVTILGPPETASSRLNLTQAFNTLGDTVAPYFGGILILGGAAAAAKHKAAVNGVAAAMTKVEQAASVKLPYMVVAGTLIVLALAIALYRFPRLELTRDFRPGSQDERKDSVWDHPHLYLGAIAIFIYVGAEVSIGSFLVKYFADPKIAGLSMEAGAKLVAFYWGGMMVGRFIGSALMRRVSASNLLAWAGVGAAVLVLCSLLGTGHFAEFTILAVGLFNSIMFPTIFTLSIAELGPLTGRGAGLLVQAIVGGAVIPVLMGFCADHFGIHHSLFLPLLCYGFIIYYGMRGSRIKPMETQSHLEPIAGS